MALSHYATVEEFDPAEGSTSPASTQQTSFRPTNRGTVLVVDDDGIARARVCADLEARGFSCETTTGLPGLLHVRDSMQAVLVVLSSLAHHAVEFVKRAHLVCTRVPIVVVGCDDCELDACSLAGAYCLHEPIDIDEVCRVLDAPHVAAQAHHARAHQARQQLLVGAQAPRGLVAQSTAMRRVLRSIELSGPSRTTVLITGESGTGKELVAEALHSVSPRRERPFVRLHCAALADSLLESELFGHERGAFTGAVARREGHFERADTGTLFLDEIGEIGPITQIKLLRVLQERAFERVGGTQTIKVDVRILAATNRDLREEVRLGRFREDLFYRLDVINIDVPPLRSRTTDVVPLAEHFLHRFALENGKQIAGFTQAATRRLQSHPWPGNVRELENAIERAVVLATGPLIDESELPAPGTESLGGVRVPGMTLDAIERWAILSAFDAAGGSTAGAAKLLGISVRKVQYRLQMYGRLTPRMVSSRESSRPPPAPTSSSVPSATPQPPKSRRGGGACNQGDGSGSSEEG